jgi:hypothetical protein
MMTIIQRQYETAEQAEHAIAALQMAGLPSSSLSLIMGMPERDAHNTRVGGFADGHGHDHDAHAEPMGSFGGDGHDAHAEPMGSFGGGDQHAGRVGGFADVDRDTVTSFSAGMHRVSASSHQQIVGMLMEAGMDQASAEGQLAAIHQGKALVLVQVAPQNVEQVNSLLAMM